jgi:hypothetical protein
MKAWHLAEKKDAGMAACWAERWVGYMVSYEVAMWVDLTAAAMAGRMAAQ